MSNIENFNNAAKAYGVPTTALFQTPDLYEGRKGQLLNVINCLNQLGFVVCISDCLRFSVSLTYAGINTSSLASVAERPRDVSCLSVFNSAIYAIFLLLVIRFQIYQRVGHNEILFLRRSRPCSVAGCDKKDSVMCGGLHGKSTSTLL